MGAQTLIDIAAQGATALPATDPQGGESNAQALLDDLAQRTDQVVGDAVEQSLEAVQPYSQQASLAAGVAIEARDQSLAASNAAFANAQAFSSIVAGLAGTAVGGQFIMEVGDYLIRYRHDAGTPDFATAVAVYPSTAFVNKVANAAVAAPTFGGEFWTGDATDNDPATSIVGAYGMPIIAVDAAGRQYQTVDRDFHGDDEAIGVALAGDGGRSLFVQDAEGFAYWPRAAEFHGDEDAVGAAILTDAGRALLVQDDEGFPYLPRVADFHGDDSPVDSAILDGNGRTLIAQDADGFSVLPSVKEFYNDDDEAELVQIVNGDRALLRWNADGDLLGVVADDGGDDGGEEAGDSDDALLAYVSGSTLRTTGLLAGMEDAPAAELGSYHVLNTAPGNALHARAIIDRPALGAASAVAVAPDLGLMIPDSDKVLHVNIGIGQSLMVGAQSAATMVSTIALFPDDVLMLTRSDGLSDVRLGLVTQDGAGAPVLNPATLIGFEPLVAKTGQGSGSRGETAMEAMANRLAQQAAAIGARFKSLSFTAAMGGTAYDGLQRGTQTYTNMLAALTKAKELAEAEGWRIIVDACLHKHGENDSANAGYYDDLIQWQADIDEDVKAITGQAAPVHFIMGMPSSQVVSGTSDRFAAAKAMLRAHNDSPYHHLAGPDYPFGSAYYTDFLHMTGPGYFWIGEQMARAWQQVLWSAANKSKIVQMLSAVRIGTNVVINYEVPVPPLVLDTTTLTERDVKGFRFFDDAGEITINSATITGPAQVTLALASTPSGSGEHVDYAFRPQPNPRTADGIVRGNLRDSATDISNYQARPLYNWAVHQTLPL